MMSNFLLPGLEWCFSGIWSKNELCLKYMLVNTNVINYLVIPHAILIFLTISDKISFLYFSVLPVMALIIVVVRSIIFKKAHR